MQINNIRRFISLLLVEKNQGMREFLTQKLVMSLELDSLPHESLLANHPSLRDKLITNSLTKEDKTQIMNIIQDNIDNLIVKYMPKPKEEKENKWDITKHTNG